MRWHDILPEKSIKLADELSSRAEQERQQGAVIYPPQRSILRALKLTQPDNVRAVVVGQDPYHEPGQANGLAFSVEKGVKLPPSLKNIFQELHDDLGVPIPVSGDLTPWAEQGVLLLNTVLTVAKGEANSHKNWGWQDFVLSVFRQCAQLPQPVVFLLWGGQARAFTEGLVLSEREGKLCLASSHPSPLGARKGSASAPAFLGSRPFSKTNEFLSKNGSKIIDWVL